MMLKTRQDEPDRLRLALPEGEFYAALFPGLKPSAAGFGTNSFDCGAGCPAASFCYARRIQGQYPGVDRVWKANSATLSAIERGPKPWDRMLELFDRVMDWSRDWSHQWFRGWVGGSPTIMQMQALAQAAEDSQIHCWIPTEKYTQHTYGESRFVTIRSSTQDGCRSRIWKDLGPFQRGDQWKSRDGEVFLVCPGNCRHCRACWSKAFHCIIYPKR